MKYFTALFVCFGFYAPPTIIAFATSKDLGVKVLIINSVCFICQFLIMMFPFNGENSLRDFLNIWYDKD
jgi:hypothetical protein